MIDCKKRGYAMQEIIVTIATLGIIYFLLFRKSKGSIKTTPINYEIIR